MVIGSDWELGMNVCVWALVAFGAWAGAGPAVPELANPGFEEAAADGGFARDWAREIGGGFGT